MSKYLCAMCGASFKKEKQSIDHMNFFDDHVVIKKKIRARVLEFSMDFLAEGGFLKVLRIIGFVTLQHILMRHFDITFSEWEIILIGMSLGFIA